MLAVHFGQSVRLVVERLNRQRLVLQDLRRRRSAAAKMSWKAEHHHRRAGGLWTRRSVASSTSDARALGAHQCARDVKAVFGE